MSKYRVVSESRYLDADYEYITDAETEEEAIFSFIDILYEAYPVGDLNVGYDPFIDKGYIYSTYYDEQFKISGDDHLIYFTIEAIK